MMQMKFQRNQRSHISAVGSGRNKEGKEELDSHANVCVAGAIWKIIEYTGVVCNVYAYSDSYKPLMHLPVDEVVSAYNHPGSETFIFVLSQALYLGECQELYLIVSLPVDIIWNCCGQCSKTYSSQL